MRIVFLGTGDIGLPSLEALIASSEHEVVAVVTQPDKPVGRKLVLTSPEVKNRALVAGIPVLQPERVRHSVAELAAFEADVFVVVAYGQLLPKAILDIPGKACLNIHASLLPRHRGASPIQAVIREGDEASGITIMWMDEGLDTGDVLLQDEFPLSPVETGGSLHDRLALLAPSSLAKALELIEKGKAPHLPQDHSRSTHCRKLERVHGRLDWQCPAEALERLIRAYCPWPGTYTTVASGEGPTAQLKIHRAQLADSSLGTLAPGVVAAEAGRLWVGCGVGALELLEVQLEGRKRLPVAEFQRGHGLSSGARLE